MIYLCLFHLSRSCRLSLTLYFFYLYYYQLADYQLKSLLYYILYFENEILQYTQLQKVNQIYYLNPPCIVASSVYGYWKSKNSGSKTTEVMLIKNFRSRYVLSIFISRPTRYHLAFVKPKICKIKYLCAFPNSVVCFFS